MSTGVLFRKNTKLFKFCSLPRKPSVPEGIVWVRELVGGLAHCTDSCREGWAEAAGRPTETA